MATNSKATAQTLNTERATKAMQVAEAALVKTSETVLKGLGDSVALATAELVKLQTQTEDKRAELDALAGDYAAKLDTENYNLRIAVRDNRDSTLNTLLREAGLTAVNPKDLQNLKDELAGAVADNKDVVAKEVGKAVGIERAKAERELAEVQAEHKVTVAEYIANAKSDKTTIELLRTQLEQGREDLQKEREARVTIEEHRSNAAGITVNNGKG